MNEKLTFNKITDDDLSQNNQEGDYKNLIIRLKEIRSIISSLEKKYFNKSWIFDKN